MSGCGLGTRSSTASSGDAGILLGCPRWIGLCVMFVTVRELVAHCRQRCAAAAPCFPHREVRRKSGQSRDEEYLRCVLKCVPPFRPPLVPVEAARNKPPELP